MSRKAALRDSTGAEHAGILGVGAYRPRRVVSNAEICERIDSSDEWIQTRSGIKNRRFAEPDETVAMMSVAAGGKALAAAGVRADEVGCVATLGSWVGARREPVPDDALDAALDLALDLVAGDTP